MTKHRDHNRVINALNLMTLNDFCVGDSDDYNDNVIIIISVAAVLLGLSLILLILVGCGIYAL